MSRPTTAAGRACWQEDQNAAEDDRIHFVLHLGDFIYERCWDERLDGSPQSRKVPPFPDGVGAPGSRDAVSLADYRHLYKTYLSDPHLQEARARWPFICTWDDHEFADDCFQSFTTPRWPGRTGGAAQTGRQPGLV